MQLCLNRIKKNILFVSCVVTLIALLSAQVLYADVACRAPANAAEERDNIFMLLAYSVVLKDWQNADMANNRGYNIGSVLVDPTGKVVFWARNSVNITKNMSQHGEVRLMNCYLATNKTTDLKGYVIYTTLEPCAMCSGMMMLTSVPRAVYGETDPSYGKALERLELDSTSLPNGYPPYPRYVESVSSIIAERCKLDALYAAYQKVTPNPHITNFLATDEAKTVFSNAYSDLLNYKVIFPENQAILDQAQAYYKTVPTTYTPYCPTE